MICLLICGLVYAWMLTNSNAAESPTAPTLHCRMEIRQAAPYWLGQRVTARLFVLSTEDLRHNPVLGPLDFPGGIALRSPGNPSYHNEQHPETGASLQGRIIDIECFPQQVGDLTLAPISIRQRIGTRELTASSPALSMTVQQPPGSEAYPTLISTNSLQVTQHWSVDTEALKTGDSIVRRIDWQAQNILGMALPQLPSRAPTGISVYTGKSIPQDRSNRGRLEGRRTDEFTYVFQEPGSYTLPGIRIPWFNTSTSTMMVHELPGRSLSISGPALSAAQTETSSTHWLAWMVTVLCLTSVAVFYFWRRQQRNQPDNLKQDLLQALHAEDASRSHRLLLQWLASLPPMEAKWWQDQLHQELLRLSRYRFAPAADKPAFKNLAKTLSTPPQRRLPPQLPALNTWSD